MSASPITHHPSPSHAARLRLPAFGKALLNERRQGRHPLVVHLVFSEEWGGGETCEECGASERGAHPRLAVRPSEFEPFRFDWHVVTGCMVCVFDGRERLDGEGAGKFYELLGELGRYAGPLVVYRLESASIGQWGLFSVPANSAYEWMKKNGSWPAWWPAETERLNGPRRERWGRLRAAATGSAQAA